MPSNRESNLSRSIKHANDIFIHLRHIEKMNNLRAIGSVQKIYKKTPLFFRHHVPDISCSLTFFWYFNEDLKQSFIQISDKLKLPNESVCLNPELILVRTFVP